MSETSTKTAAETETLSAFATLRFSGDRLEPERVTVIIGSTPTSACRKGEIYRTGRSGETATGQTGIWYLSTRKVVASRLLLDHLEYLADLISPRGGADHVSALRHLIADQRLEVDVSCFWYGKHGAKPPAIPGDIRSAFARIGATIETDFDTD